MTSELVCPVCGNPVGRGSTHCIRCGSRLDGSVTASESAHKPSSKEAPATPLLDRTEAMMADFLSEGPTTLPKKQTDEEEATLPSLEETELEELDMPPPSPTAGSIPSKKEGSEELKWDEEGPDKLVDVDADAHGLPEDSELTGAGKSVTAKPVSSPGAGAKSQPIVWDDLDERVVSTDEVREGNPYTEIEPPKVTADSDEMTAVEITGRMLLDECDDTSREAVAHLFPTGRGTTSRGFIDAVVGKPRKIGARVTLPEADTPACPTCGAPITDDGFQYPPYVFESMGRARLEAGLQLLKDAQHEKAIESFEKAKLLADKSENAKLIEDATRRVDEGYEAMATAHYDEGENHLKAQEYEWAIVQFKKARELYMLTTDAKMRAKCMERTREVFSIWGKVIEDEADAAAKRGQSRDALMMYQQAAEKYRSADDTKRLKGLERKIRKA